MITKQNAQEIYDLFIFVNNKFQYPPENTKLIVRQRHVIISKTDYLNTMIFDELRELGVHSYINNEGVHLFL